MFLVAKFAIDHHWLKMLFLSCHILLGDVVKLGWFSIRWVSKYLKVIPNALVVMLENYGKLLKWQELVILSLVLLFVFQCKKKKKNNIISFYQVPYQPVIFGMIDIATRLPSMLLLATLSKRKRTWWVGSDPACTFHVLQVYWPVSPKWCILFEAARKIIRGATLWHTMYIIMCHVPCTIHFYCSSFAPIF